MRKDYLIRRQGVEEMVQWVKKRLYNIRTRVQILGTHITKPGVAVLACSPSTSGNRKIRVSPGLAGLTRSRFSERPSLRGIR